MALLLQLRTRTKKNTFTNPSLLHLFSTTNSNEDEPDSTTTTASDDRSSTNPNSTFSSYFSDVKKVLKQRQSTSPSPTPENPLTSSFTASGSVPQTPSKVASIEEIRKNLSEFRHRYSDPSSTPSSLPSSLTPANPLTSSFTASGSVSQTPSKVASFEEIRKNLSEFRRRYSDPNSTPSSSPSSNPISFQEIYKRNMIGKPGDSTPNADLGPGKIGGKLSFDAIRESVRNRVRNIEPSGSDRKDVDPMSLKAFTESLRMKPSDSTVSRTPSTVIGGTGTLPASVFGKEMREKEEGDLSEEMKMEFLKMYKHEELGDRLRRLRPEAKGEDWFSLKELSERLMKLREMEEKETEESSIKGLTVKDLREVLIRVKISEDKTKKSSLQRLDILGELGRTPSFMLQPPKEHLVEKYFHPDNMSSTEKLKIELARVRDEFKMSETDCGSSRVQVAQLTTKIKHLSSVLHKKDKHSRKGLLAMVQKRKRLLKYLRRTDWDSYCFVISKLGLRDNPDTKY